MPNYGAMLRPSALASSARSHLRSTHRALSKFARPNSFSCPAAPAAVLPRVKRNLSHFKIHYAALLWVSLLLSLAARHRPTMLFLMAASKVALLYEVLLKAVPGSWRIARRLLDRRLVMGAFLGAVLVELVVTGAVARLGVAMGVGVPVVLLHAVFKVGDDLSGSDVEMKEGDADPIGGEKKDDADLESSSGSSAR